MSVYFLNGPTPASFCLFSVFTNNTIFTANQCEKCPTSIWRRDSNPRPLEHESSPTTTRLGLPPLCRFIIITQMILIYFISGCITVPSTAGLQVIWIDFDHNNEICHFLYRLKLLNLIQSKWRPAVQ